MAIRALKDAARVTALALASAAASFAASPAFAGAGEVTTVVTPLSTNVSYTESATDPIFIVYAVSVTNDVGNTINNIVFTGATAPTSALATFDSATGATCTTTTPDKTAISCSIGQLKAGIGTVFYVTFRAPTAAAGSTKTLFSGTTFYAEGTGGLENSTPQNSTRPWTAEDVTLGTESPNYIKSGVPQVNRTLKFFTAPNVFDTALTDQITTTVSVAGTAPITSTLTILEEALPTDDTNCIAQGNFYRCYASTLTIPDDTSTAPPTPFQYASGSGKYLGITLRIERAAIKPGFKTSNVRVTYDGATINACQVTSPTGAPITYAVVPCYTGIVYYKNWTKNSSWPKAWEGSVDVFGVNDKNGRWGIN